MSQKLQLRDEFYKVRRAGVLLHPTSLPGVYGSGDLGHDAYRFIEFIQASGFSVWQMLPLGPTHADGSPYQSLSAHAGNPLLISIDWLIDRGWLPAQSPPAQAVSQRFRRHCLYTAFANFEKKPAADWLAKLKKFEQQHADWLPDYSLFTAIKQEQQDAPWMAWPEKLRLRDKAALRAAATRLAPVIKQIVFEQFVFFTQWHEIREYASQRGVMMFGDMPIFVAQDSADVWAQRDNFMLDAQGEPRYVAGVPPDAFSDTGQRWGNPLYDWPAMQADKFSWWLSRFKTQLELFDVIRIDHFRGFAACWQIAATATTAMQGEWVNVPGRDLLKRVRSSFPDLLLVAEDLGVITEEVNALRDEFDFPGMKILQFAFGETADNLYLPHHHVARSVVYTGTHDNDTTLGWLQSNPHSTRQHVQNYIGCGELDNYSLLAKLMNLALASVAQLAILPMQDLLDGQHRMNKPGTTTDNWRWRFGWQQLASGKSEWLRSQLQLYGRCK